MIPGFKATRSNFFQTILQSGVFSSPVALEEHHMRPNQRHVFDFFRDERLMLVTQPPGSGKSTLIKFIHGHDLVADKKRKIIIAIPQTVIAKTFRRGTLVFDDNSRITWDVQKDLCTDTSRDKINEVVAFLRCQSFPEGIHERVLICTHATLALVYVKIGAKLKDHLKNTTFVIDEAHHVLSADGSGTDIQNRLGQFCDLFMRVDEPTSKLWLTTATYFRGDELSILKKRDYERLKKHFLPLDKHWMENIKYIESYSYDFMVYQTDPWKEIREILRRGKQKTIFYIPSAAGMLVRGNKQGFTSTLIDLIRQEWGQDTVILDLVDSAGRNERKTQLEQEAQSVNLDAVISVSMVNEGTDWPFASQIIDVAPSSSLRIAVQRFGRLIRDREGKNHLYYFMLLPFCFDQLDEEDYRRTLNNNFAAFTASMLIEDCIRPVVIPRPNADAGVTSESKLNYLQQELPDVNDQRQLVDDVRVALLVLRGQGDDNAYKFDPEEIQDVVEDTIRDAGVFNHVSEIAKVIIGMFRRRAVKYDVDVAWTVEEGFEKIWRDEIFDNLLSFVTGMCGIKTFSEFRSIYESRQVVQWDTMYARTKQAIQAGDL